LEKELGDQLELLVRLLMPLALAPQVLLQVLALLLEQVQQHIELVLVLHLPDCCG
jgi:hypothetical protein